MATYNVMLTIGNVTIQQIQQYIKYKIELNTYMYTN